MILIFTHAEKLHGLDRLKWYGDIMIQMVKKKSTKNFVVIKLFSL